MIYDRYRLIVILFFIAYNSILSQVVDTGSVDNSVESLLENISDENSYIYFNYQIQRLTENPLNINSASISDLTEIPFLTPGVAKEIINYRNDHKSFKNLAELYNILKNEDLYNSIQPFVMIDNNQRVNKIKISSSFMNNFEQSRGYDSAYTGSSFKSINKLQFSYSPFNMKGGLILDKDPGENTFTDFYAGYLNFNISNINIIFGDFLVEYGQGLCIAGPYSLSKSSNAILSVKKHFNGTNPYLSAMENQFLRGISVQTSLDSLKFSVFYSNNTSDATVQANGEVSSLLLTGYHRTESEISKKHSLNEIIMGGRIGYSFGDNEFGMNFYKSKFDKNLAFDGFYSSKGNDSYSISFNYDIKFNKINFFGEIAKAKLSDIALVTGSIIEVSENLNFSLFYRKYPSNFINLHSSSFGENGNTQNEEGIYFGVYFHPLSFIKINAYYDFYHFPYRTYFNPLPTYGKEGLIAAEVKINRFNKISLKYRSEIKEETIPAIDTYNRDIKIISIGKKENIRVEINSTINESLKLRGRIELKFFHNPDLDKSEKGLLLFNDINFKLYKNLTTLFRIIFFDSDSFSTAIYENETDIDGVYNNIALSGKGRRLYVMVIYNYNDIFHFSLKYSNTFYDNVKSLGTGYDTIIGNSLNRISMQLTMNL